MAWTEQQQEAIDSRNKNLLVAAAAGSGKTAVLVNRIAEIISSGECNIDEMLIVTFTDAAAKEMRTRIHTEILKRMREETDAEKLAKLERQSILLSGASIMTFHSFCLNVLKRHFSKIELDPKFRTAEENELKILMQEVVEELFEENYANATQEFLKFTDEFGGNDRGDSILHSLVIGLYNFSQSRPYPEKWLHSLVDDYEFKTSEKFNGLTWFDYTMKIAKSQVEENLQNVSEECQNAIKTANNSKIYTGGDSKISANWDKLIQILEDDFFVIDNFNKSKNNWDELYEKLHKDKKMFGNFLSGGYKLNDELKDVKAEILAARNAYKKILENLRDKTVDFTEKEIKSEMFELAESVNEFVRVTIEFGKKFSAAKRERGIIDFNDMEHLAMKILSDKSTAKIYREKFKIIMVDEYQDTNGVQEEIIGKFVRDNNFFAVGDVKQSIYRFRQADPEIFMKKYDEYPNLDNSKRIDLSKNFRSRDEVINSVNAIFEQLMNKKDMEIEYDDDAKLYRGAIYPEHENIFNEPTEFFIITEENKNKNFSTADDDDENKAEELAGIEREIQLIANKIKNLMQAKKNVWDKDTNEYRPLKYRDIVILLRSVDGKASKIVDVLKKNEIPAYAADKEGYFKAEEIQIILSLLTVLDNARQDIPLASVMLSPIGGFTAEDLANLRIKNRYADLYTLVNENPEICGEFLNKINRWRELARQVSVPELLSTIYRETGYYDFVGKSFRGKIAQANLRMLVDRAAQYETTAFRGLSRFIKFMKKIRDLNNDLSSARTLGENEDVVRVMTIHKSKGLEFPVVFVAELGKKFNTTDTKKNILLHRKLGIGIYRAVESDYGLMKLPTFARRIIAEKIKYENLAEELRVLYVAFTRAREKLFLVGTFKGNSDSIFKLFADFNKQPKDDEKLSTQIIKSAVNPLNWLIPAAQFAQKFIKTEILSEDEIATSTIEILPEELAEEKFALPEKVEESPLKNIPAKISVTELKRRAELEEDFGEQFETLQNKKSGKKILYRRPDFERTNKISGSEYGTIVHSVMQMLDLNSDLSLEGITTQISEMVDKKLILPEHAKIIRVKNIAEFFKSPIGERLLNSDEIYRELPFSRLISAKDFFKQAGEEKIFIQGIIDLLFQDSATKNWILLDYKTDSPAEDEIFKERYKIQIQLYAQAIENLLGLKIAEKYLYMISSGKTIEM